MSTMDRIARAIEDQVVRKNNRPKIIHLSPAKWVDFMTEVGSAMHRAQSVAYKVQFMGVVVVMDQPTGFCRTCGAPSEPTECSYCHSPSEYILLE